MGKYDIAPLRPPTLATFRSWGSSAGAGRTKLTRCKSTKIIGAAKKKSFSIKAFFLLPIIPLTRDKGKFNSNAGILKLLKK